MTLDEIAARHDRRAAEREEASRRSDRLGNLRLALAGVALVLLLLPLYTRSSGPWWALAALAGVFVVLGARHARLEDRLRRAASAAAYWAAERDRATDRWRALVDDGADLAPKAEGFDAAVGLAGDLDLFGRASLFQRLSRAVTAAGRRTLARWMLEPARAEDARARQAAVVELAAAAELREALSVAARAGTEGTLADEAMLAWGEQADPLPYGSALRALALLESAAVLVGLGLYLAADRPAPLAAALAIVALTQLAIRTPVASRLERVATPDRAIERYAELLRLLEGAPLSAPALVALKARLATEGVSASLRVAELSKVIERLEYTKNAFFGLTIGLVSFWDLHGLLAAERWQRVVGPKLRAWLEVIGELEALASLGAYLAEEPRASMPELVDEEGFYEAEALAHPLLDRGAAVANDLRLGGAGSVLLLSGSNMSGKSTFLRAIALSVLMAEMGAPVLARRLKSSRFHLATSIRVVDSLAQGASHFYAELLRIKHVLSLGGAERARLLYLLDEMLHGTNSRERYIGAVAVIRHLSRAGAVGVVTTHDLSLARVAGELPEGRVTNRHFGDEVEGETIRFDYRLRDGAVRSTNALRLMRAIGIDIELSAPEP